MEIIVKENRQLIIKDSESTQNENDIQNIKLIVPPQYEDFDKKIAFVTEEGVKWGLVENNMYKLERSITKFENVLIYVWLTKDDQDFRSVEEALTFNKNHKVDGEITPEEQTDMERAISILEGEITKVDNLDIDAVKVGDTATITITDKNGISKSVQVKDGQVSESQIQEIIQIVQASIDIPENLSDLNEDSTHRTVTDSEKTTWNNKQNALVSGTNIKTINNQSILGEGNINIEGGSGTTDYSDLENKPKINNVELNGNKSLQDLGITEVTEQTVASWGFTKNTGTYSKPSGGIPKTDLESSVQTSLNKADTALQSYTETDPTVPSHVKNISQADISNWNNKSDFSGDYEDLDNQPSINGVTLLGNKTAEDLGIIGSVCNLGMFSDYPQDNRLDLNKLTPGVYLLYRDISNLYVKATYKDNEILGGYLLRESTLDNIYFLIMHKRITDDLSVGSYVGKFISFRVKDGASSMVNEESTSIEIYSDIIRINTGTTNTINTVTRDNSQTITGKKTFNTLPESSVVPTTDNQLVNKKYVDDSIGDIETVLTTITTGGGVNGNS